MNLLVKVTDYAQYDPYDADDVRRDYAGLGRFRLNLAAE